MQAIITEELLKDKDILNEINKYKWIESEKKGADIGFERASREWINEYSKKYLARHPAKTTSLWIKSQPILNVLYKEVKL